MKQKLKVIEPIPHMLKGECFIGEYNLKEIGIQGVARGKSLGP